jgi:hypothetical protein
MPRRSCLLLQFSLISLQMQRRSCLLVLRTPTSLQMLHPLCLDNELILSQYVPIDSR